MLCGFQGHLDALAALGVVAPDRVEMIEVARARRERTTAACRRQTAEGDQPEWHVFDDADIGCDALEAFVTAELYAAGWYRLGLTDRGGSARGLLHHPVRH